MRTNQNAVFDGSSRFTQSSLMQVSTQLPCTGTPMAVVHRQETATLPDGFTAGTDDMLLEVGHEYNTHKLSPYSDEVTREEPIANFSPRTVRSAHLNCTVTDCRHKKPFPRDYELQRHIQYMHCTDRPFCCPYLGCYKGQATSSFARPDKLTSHIRAVHGRQTETLLQCCITDCSCPPLPLDLLGQHIRFAHPSSLTKHNPLHDANLARAIRTLRHRIVDSVHSGAARSHCS